ncbi:MAG TPA: hypothetical protein PLS65_03995 [Ferruginibacter sp.]|nr:hypothetical protein [Ferruginibacter sp.]
MEEINHTFQYHNLARMFIKRLYRYNPFLFVAFILFLLAFLVVNYKWGTVATPVMQFGMYSKHYSVKDTQVVFLVDVNGKRIDAAALSLSDRDLFQIYPDAFFRQPAANTAARETMRKYLAPVGLDGYMSDKKFINPVADSSFWHWYGAMAAKVLDEPIQTMAVYKQAFTWGSGKLEPAGSPVKLYSLGIE